MNIGTNIERILIQTWIGDQTQLMSAKDAALLEVLQWSHMRRQEKDLVLLDVMNKPLIIYNLRKRFQVNEIYVSPTDSFDFLN